MLIQNKIQKKAEHEECLENPFILQILAVLALQQLNKTCLT